MADLGGLEGPVAETVAAFAESCTGEATERVAVVTAAGDLLRLENVHPEPERNFRVADLPWLEALERAAVVVHSHPVATELAWTPSPCDQRSQFCQRVPWAVVCPDGSVFTLGLERPERPLLGRGFRFGVDDCFGLFRDAWRRWSGEPLPNFPRRWRWWADGEPLIERGLMTAEFAAVPTEEIQRGDAVLFKVRGEVFNHVAFYEGGGQMLHHPGPARPYDPTQLSRREAVERWLQIPHQVVRRGAHV